MPIAMNPTPERPSSAQETPEQQKQKEINETVNQTRQELWGLGSVMEKIKTAIDNFGVMLGGLFTSFKSFIGMESGENQPNVSSPTQAERKSTEKKERDVYVKDAYPNEPKEVQLLLQQPMMDAVKENQLEFAKGLCRLAHKHGWRPEHYLAVMFNETAGTMSPSVQNPDSKATGLLQFMPETAASMGTSINALKRMSNVEQLEYVDKYITMTGGTGKINSLPDLYMVVFFPAALNHRDESGYVFEAKNLSAWKVARANPMFNINKDGRITMKEFRKVVDTTIGWRIQDMSHIA